MTQTLPPVDLLDGLAKGLEPAFRLQRLVAVSPERALYHAWDRLLKRYVALHLHLEPDSPSRAWFLRETETLAALDPERPRAGARPPRCARARARTRGDHASDRPPDAHARAVGTRRDHRPALCQLVPPQRAGRGARCRRGVRGAGDPRRRPRRARQ